MPQLSDLQKANDQMTKRMFSALQPISSRISARNLSDALLGSIAGMINDGTLQAGYTFPNENEMCKHLQIGRSTLRETYKALMALGYISRSKSGTTVNNPTQILSAMPLNTLFKTSDINNIDEFRQMLETECCYLAAMRATPAQIAKMRSILDDMRANSDDVSRVVQDDVHFHLAIADASGNEMMKNTLIAATDELESSASAGFSTNANTIEISIDFHEQILAAIAGHDSKRAKKIMREHIKNIYIVLRNLKEMLPPQGSAE